MLNTVPLLFDNHDEITGLAHVFIGEIIAYGTEIL